VNVEQDDIRRVVPGQGETVFAIGRRKQPQARMAPEYSLNHAQVGGVVFHVQHGLVAVV